MTREIGGGDPFQLCMMAEGSDVRNHNLDYRGAQATPIYVKPPTGYVYIVTSAIVFVKAPVSDMAPDKYGHLPALPNGIVVKIRQAGVSTTDVSDAVPIRCNADWLRIGRYSEYFEGTKGTGSSYWISRWEYTSVGEPIFLDGSLDMDLAMLLHDDFRTLEEHYFVMLGYFRLK